MCEERAKLSLSASRNPRDILVLNTTHYARPRFLFHRFQTEPILEVCIFLDIVYPRFDVNIPPELYLPDQTSLRLRV